MRLFKFLLILVVLAIIGLIGFAFLGDLSPDRTEVRIPVELDGN